MRTLWHNAICEDSTDNFLKLIALGHAFDMSYNQLTFNNVPKAHPYDKCKHNVNLRSVDS